MGPAAAAAGGKWGPYDKLHAGQADQDLLVRPQHNSLQQPEAYLLRCVAKVAETARALSECSTHRCSNEPSNTACSQPRQWFKVAGGTTLNRFPPIQLRSLEHAGTLLSPGPDHLLPTLLLFADTVLSCAPLLPLLYVRTQS